MDSEYDLRMKRNLTGLQFGRWKVLEFSGYYRGIKGSPMWRCVCSCGKERAAISGGNLMKGISTSCGCSRIGVRTCKRPLLTAQEREERKEAAKIKAKERWLIVSQDPKYLARVRESQKRSYLKHKDKNRAKQREYLREWNKSKGVLPRNEYLAKIAKRREDLRLEKEEKQKTRRAVIDAKKLAEEDKRRMRQEMLSDPSYLENIEQRRKERRRIEKKKAGMLPQNKLRKNLRKKFKRALNSGNGSGSFYELFGCTGKELVIHIENQFSLGMTWQNYGEWHIDHIIPVSMYDTNHAGHVKLFSHHKNLRPLWGDDNVRKSNALNKKLVKAHGILSLMPKAISKKSFLGVASLD